MLQLTFVECIHYQAGDWVDFEYGRAKPVPKSEENAIGEGPRRKSELAPSPRPLPLRLVFAWPLVYVQTITQSTRAERSFLSKCKPPATQARGDKIPFLGVLKQATVDNLPVGVRWISGLI